MNKILIIFTIFFYNLYNCCDDINGTQEQDRIQTCSNHDEEPPEKLEQDCELTKDHKHAAIADRRYRWPNALVPYLIDPHFPPAQHENIEIAMRTISNVTCVKFKKRTNDRNFVFFYFGGNGCNGYIGMQGKGQIINLKPGDPGYFDCGDRLHTVIHEILHALGIDHEMSRPDRDEYVTIVRDNIQEGQEYNFDYPDAKQETYGIPFDYHSIMMYKWNAFAKDPNKPTIIAKKPGVGTDFRGKQLSKNDIALINTMYNCRNQ